MAHASVSWGLLLPTREVVMAQGAPDLTKIIDLAVQAEALGFDSVWVGDSILARPRLEALTTLAAVASRTTRVKLGTAVLLSALRHPVVLANEAANVDILLTGGSSWALGSPPGPLLSNANLPRVGCPSDVASACLRKAWKLCAACGWIRRSPSADAIFSSKMSAWACDPRNLAAFRCGWQVPSIMRCDGSCVSAMAGSPIPAHPKRLRSWGVVCRQ